MAETTTLADYTRAKRGESKPLPDSPGYWVWSDSSESESVEAIDRDGDGDLVWHPTGRPVSECDSGEYYGPFALTRLEAIRQFTAEIRRLRAENAELRKALSQIRDTIRGPYDHDAALSDLLDRESKDDLIDDIIEPIDSIVRAALESKGKQ